MRLTEFTLATNPYFAGHFELAIFCNIHIISSEQLHE